MNHLMILKKALRMNSTADFFCFLTIVFCMAVPSHAQYHSGNFSVLITGSTSAPVPFDFSEASDSCSFSGANLCGVSIADAEIGHSTVSVADTLSSIYGILDLGLFDTNGLAQIGQIPTDGYINKTEIKLHHIYAVKTSEGNFGAIFYKEYISGGFDEKFYSWAYQENGSNDLTPPSLVNRNNRTPSAPVCREGKIIKEIIFKNCSNPSVHDLSIYNLLGQKHVRYHKTFLISPGMHLTAQP